MGVVTVLLLAVVAAVLLRAARRRKRPASVAPRSARRGALLFVIGIIGAQLVLAPPAMAAECGEAPNPERPGSGMVGAIDPPMGKGAENSAYFTYGYAGMVWNVYDDNCMLSKTITDPDSTMDTWAGNQLFNLSKNIVGATNSLHYTLLNGGVLGALNERIGEAAKAVFSNIYMQLFSLFAVLLAVFIFRHIWRGDLATVSKRGLFALAGAWLAASSMVLVANYDRIDDLIVKTTTNIQAGFVDPDEDRVVRHILPTDLHNKVVYQNWLRGEFGSPDDPKAKEFGRKLLDAQAWTWTDVRTGQDANQAKMDAKKEAYKKIATQLGPATGYFKGTDGSRTGAGFLAFFQSLVYSLFQFLAKATVLLAQVLLRVLTLTAPVIGLVAILHHDLLRKVGRVVGAVVLNVLILSVLAGIHFQFLQLIFGPAAQLNLLTQMALAAIVTIIFLMVGRPVRRMWQMVQLSVGAAGSAVPSAGQGLFSRFRKGGKNLPTPQDEFWDTVRDSETPDGARAGRRVRPEASNPITVSADRMDGNRGSRTGVATVLPNTGTYGALPGRRSAGSLQAAYGAAEHGQTGHARPDTTMSGTPSTSRRVDTPPVTDRGWDRGEDSVVVPSRLGSEAPPQPVSSSQLPAPSPSVPANQPAINQPPPRPRRTESEVVAGRPVSVLFRPSRGLEVRDDRDTDAAVR